MGSILLHYHPHAWVALYLCKLDYHWLGSVTVANVKYGMDDQAFRSFVTVQFASFGLKHVILREGPALLIIESTG